MVLAEAGGFEYYLARLAKFKAAYDMNLPTLLWIDLRLRRFPPVAEPNLCGLCKGVVERRPDSIQDAVARWGAQLVCFDFDYPHIEGLQAL